MPELPQFKRCCFCVPLRYGLLAWGYFKLISTLYFFITYLLEIFKIYPNRSPGLLAFLTVIIIFAIVNIIFLSIFIAGAHMKNYKLLKIYYYAGIVGFIISILLSLVVLYLYTSVFIIFARLGGIDTRTAFLILTSIAAMFLDIAMQGYLILLTRSEIIKLKSNCKFEFVNNEVNAECQLRVEPGEQPEKNRPEFS